MVLVVGVLAEAFGRGGASGGEAEDDQGRHVGQELDELGAGAAVGLILKHDLERLERAEGHARGDCAAARQPETTTAASAMKPRPFDMPD